MTAPDEKKTRAAVLRAFEKHRAKPGASFDEEEFLDYLMGDWQPLGTARSSLGAMRRLSGFYDTLQLDCAVCLEYQDMENSWPLDDLVALILRKKQNQNAQRGLARRRLETAERGIIYEPLKFGLLLLLPAFFILWGFFSSDRIAGVVLFLICALVAFGIYLLQRKELAYSRLLLEAVSSVKAEPPPPAPPAAG